ncbi:MAG: hypothetical protein ACOYOP_09585 [Microthrixaceae bacterium]
MTDRRPAPSLRPVPERAPSARFAEVVRVVTSEARRRGLAVPVFRSPPSLPGVDRTLRRRVDGTQVVAVRLAGRPVAALQADVIDGVVAANGLSGRPADRFRRAAWTALEGAPPVRPVPTASAAPGPVARPHGGSDASVA